MNTSPEFLLRRSIASLDSALTWLSQASSDLLAYEPARAESVSAILRLVAAHRRVLEHQRSKLTPPKEEQAPSSETIDHLVSMMERETP